MLSSLSNLPRFALFMVVALSLNLSAPGHAQTPKYFDPEWRIVAPSMTGLPRLRFLTSLDFPPFNFADANKKPTGLNVELARAICAELEIEAVCEIQAMPWSELEEALLAGRGEAIIAGTAVSAEKRSSFGLSQTYFKFPARFIGQRDFEFDQSGDLFTTLDGKSVAVIENSAHEAMLAAYFPNVQAVPVTDIQSVYEATKSGIAALGFVDGVASSFWLASPDSENCCAFIGEAYYSDRFLGLGMAVVTRQEDQLLLQAINAALKATEESGKYLEIFQRYFPLSPHGNIF